MAKEPSPNPGGTVGPESGGDTLPPGTIALPKRGRGRPPGSKTRPKGEAVSSPAGAARDPVDVTFVVETSGTFLEIADTALDSLLVRRARAVLPPEYVEKLAKLRSEASWSEKELELVKKAVGEIAKKYDFATKYGPEILLGFMLTSYGVKQARVFAMLSRLETEIRQARPRGPAPKPEEPVAETPPPAATAQPEAKP